MTTKDTRVEREAEVQPRTSETEVAPAQENSVAAAEVRAPDGGGPSDTPLLDGVEPTALEAAEARLEASDARLAELRTAADAGDPAAVAEYRAAMGSRATELADEITGLSEDDRTAFLENGGAARITGVLEAARASGDPAAVAAVVQTIMGTSENVGDVEVELIADAVREVGLQNLGPVIREAMQNGGGAKLAVELAFGASASHTDGRFAEEISRDLQQVDANFASSAARAETIRNQRAAAVARMQAAGLNAEEIAAWEANFDTENAGAMEAYERNAARYASTLEGRAHGQSMHGDRGPFSLENARHLANSQAGGRAVAEALLRSGEGTDTWLAIAGSDMSPEERERLVTQGAMQGVGALAATGDIEGIRTLVAGLENFGGDPGALQGLRDRLSAIDTNGLTGADLRSAILGAFEPGEGAPAQERSLLQRLGLSADIGTAAGMMGQQFGVFDGVSEATGRPLPGAGRLAAGFSALSSGLGLLQNAGTQDLARLGLSGAQFGVDAISLIRNIPRGLGLGIGAAFSVVDAALHVRDGNYAAAGAALLPLIGMGIGAVLGGPLGAAIGGGIGSLANGLLAALGITGPTDEIRPLIEPAIIQSLLARGADGRTAAAMAERLSAPGIGESFHYMAATMGLDTDQLLTQLATAPPGYSAWFLDQVSSNIRFGDEGVPFQRLPTPGRNSDIFFETMWELSPQALAEMDPRRARQWDGNPLFMAQRNARATVAGRDR